MRRDRIIGFARAQMVEKMPEVRDYSGHLITMLPREGYVPPCPSCRAQCFWYELELDGEKYATCACKRCETITVTKGK